MIGSKKIRILHITTSLGVGGAERILVDLAIHQKNQGHDVSIFSLREREFYGSELLRSEINVENLLNDPPSSRLMYLCIMILRMPRLLIYALRVKPDVIHTWMYLADLLGGLVGRLLKTPVLWGIFNGSLDSRFYGTGTKILIRACKRFSNSIPTAIISCSAYGRRTHIAAGYPGDRMLYVPTGFDEPNTPISVAAGQPFQSQFESKADSTDGLFRIGMLARVSTEKDHLLLLQAHSQLVLEQFNVCLHFAGGIGVEPGSILENKVLNLGLVDSVSLDGRISDVSSWISKLDVFVLLSKSEGFPTVIGEAMSLGKPCIVSNVGDVKILVNDRSQIVPVGDLEAVVRTLKMFFQKSADDRLVCGIRNRKRIRKCFSKNRMFRRYDSIYRAIVTKIEY